MTHKSETKLAGAHPESMPLKEPTLQEKWEAICASADRRAESPIVVVPREPTRGMLAAGHAAYCRKADDAEGPSPTEHPDEGGGPLGYAYRAMVDAGRDYIAARAGQAIDAGEAIIKTLTEERDLARKERDAAIKGRITGRLLTYLGYVKSEVTDEMVKRARDEIYKCSDPSQYDAAIRAALETALSEKGAKAAAQQDYEARILSSLIPAAKPAVGAGVGIGAAIAFVRKRCDEYVAEHGIYDPETGATEFPGNGDETVCEWEEIIEGLEAIRAALSRGTAKPGGEKP